jgi:hypothetical protein
MGIKYFHYACRDQGSGFAAAAIFGANTPLFGAIYAFDAVAVVTGFWGTSACCRWARSEKLDLNQTSDNKSSPSAIIKV